MKRVLLNWLLAACVLALPVVYVIGPLDHWRAVDYVAAWLYAALLVGVLAALARRAAFMAELARGQARRAAWLGGVWRGQTRGAWLLAGALAFGGAYALVRAGVGVPPQPAVWVKLLLDAPIAAPPAVALRYGAAESAAVPVQWQPYGATTIALRPAPGAGEPPLRVLAIQTDQGALPLAQVKRDGAPVAGELTVTNPAGALLSWPQPTRAFTLTLAGRGAAEALWFDQRGTATLGAQPATLALRLPAAWQGWALLPPQFVAQLAVDMPAGATLQRVEVWSDPPQSWDVAGLSTPAVARRVELPGFRPLNAHSPLRAALVTLALAALLIALLVALLLIVRHIAPRRAPAEAGETTFGAWLRQRTARWRRGWVLLAVWLVALAWHTVYALNVPFDYTNDSPGYYEFGQQLLQTQQFAHILSERTPGYPAFLALVMLGAGDSALTIVLLQHLALSLLAPLTVWALAGRVPLAGAALAGLAVAFLPGVSVLANMIHTEALYTFFSTTALLLFVRAGERGRGLLLVGLLIGMATMLRPTGLLVLGALVGWLLLRGWCAPAGAAQRAALLGSVALGAGCAAVVAPWVLHLALVRHTLDLSGGRAGLTRWISAIDQRRLDPALPVARPDRAVWTLWMDRAYQPWTDPFNIEAIAPGLITGIGTTTRTHAEDTFGNPRVFAELVQEAGAADTARLRANQRVALHYNVLMRWDATSDFVGYVEISEWFLRNWQTPPQQPPRGSSNGIAARVERMVYRPLPPFSWVRSLCLRASQWAYYRWFLAALPALLSIVLLLWHRAARALVPCWLYWIGSVLSTSVIGMPVQRYIVVVEPLLCTLAAVCIVLLATCRWRARVAAHPPPKFGYNSASDAVD